MKNRSSQILAMMFVTLGLFSCSGDSDGSGGCTDPEGINFSADVTSDDGSCLYSADMIAGDWRTSEEMTFSNPLSGASGSGTDSYTITIVKIENNMIKIETDRSNAPGYDLGNYSFEYKVDWEQKTIGPLGLFSGEIIDEDHIDIDYQLGLPEGLYTVQLKLEKI